MGGTGCADRSSCSLRQSRIRSPNHFSPSSARPTGSSYSAPCSSPSSRQSLQPFLPTRNSPVLPHHHPDHPCSYQLLPRQENPTQVRSKNRIGVTLSLWPQSLLSTTKNRSGTS